MECGMEYGTYMYLLCHYGRSIINYGCTKSVLLAMVRQTILSFSDASPTLTCTCTVSHCVIKVYSVHDFAPDSSGGA